MNGTRTSKLRTPGRCTAGIGIPGLLVALSASAQPGPAYEDWGVPQPTVGGGCPIESRDGNHLYTASGSAGTLDIWVYERNGRVGSFQNRTRIGEPVSLDDANDFCPTPLTGGWLMFVSNRSGPQACGSSDIYLARINSAQDSGVATHLGCAPDGPNTPGTEFSPSLVTTSEGSFLYFSSDDSGDQNIYRSEMAPDGSFGPGVAVAELNTTWDDRQPNVSRDGLTIVFASDRDSGVFDVFMATRASLNDEWSEPRNLSLELAFPTAGASETRPSLSWDLQRLYYGAGGTVYVSERGPQNRSSR